MDLWIRSQDRTQLLKAIGLYYDYQKEKHHITCITENDYFWIGIYKTKERALEVLDEIENALLNKWANNVKYEKHYDDENPRSLVYEMPKE